MNHIEPEHARALLVTPGVLRVTPLGDESFDFTLHDGRTLQYRVSGGGGGCDTCGYGSEILVDWYLS